MKEIVENYQNLLRNFSGIIHKSGFRNNFLSEKMGMTPANFTIKKQRGNWTVDEVEKLLSIIENEDLQDYYLGLVMTERIKNDEFISFETFKAQN